MIISVRMLHKCRGAISVLLVLIFLASYVFAGLLVDGGRYRMAQAHAELALDAATDSVLANFNSLLFDLYGLFGTDIPGEDPQAAMEAMLTDYVEKTLGIAEVDSTSAKSLLNTLIGAVSGAQEPNYFDGYDFEIELQEATSAVTLANTAYVEYQIVEAMKYRAPMALVDETIGQFLEALNGILSLTERISKTADKIELTQGKETLYENTAQLATDIYDFAGLVLEYALNPHKDWKLKATTDWKTLNVASTTYNKYRDVYDYTDELDKNCDLIISNNSWSEDTTEDDVRQVESSLREEHELFTAKLKHISDNAKFLNKVADSLYQGVYTQLEQYERYIQQLYDKLNEDPDNPNHQTVYLPEIEQAESYCGELLKNLNLLLTVRRNAEYIYDKFLLSGYIVEASNLTIDRLMYNVRIASGLEEGAPQTPVSLTAMLKSGSYGDGGTNDRYFSYGKEYVTESNTMLKTMHELALDFREYRQPEVDVKNTSVDNEATSEEKQEAQKTEGLRDVKPLDTVVFFDKSASMNGIDEETLLAANVDNNGAFSLLKVGLRIIEELGKILENGRDNLYINEYIIMTFPNYVDDYKMAPSPLPAYTKTDSEFYWATQAGVEFVLTGHANAQASVWSVRGQLMGLRTIFNAAAIFTDSAKIQQASAIAAAISGPFAPLVTIALLVGWAVAESALDVVVLMDGLAGVRGKDKADGSQGEMGKPGTVPIFKQGKDWLLSIDGLVGRAVETGVSMAADAAKKAISKKINELSEKINAASSSAIYQAYKAVNNAAATTIDAALTPAQNAAIATIDQWHGNVKDSLSQVSDEAEKVAQDYTGQLSSEGVTFTKNTVNKGVDQLQGKVDNAAGQLKGAIGNISTTAKNEVAKLTGDVAEQAVVLIADAVGQAEKKINNAIGSGLDKAATYLIDNVTGFISDKLPLGQVVNTGATDPASGFALDYMGYMRIFLFVMSGEKKVQNIQRLIQASMRYGGQKTFSMNGAYGGISVALEVKTKYLFMTEAVVGRLFKDAKVGGWSPTGGMLFTVYSDITY